MGGANREDWKKQEEETKKDVQRNGDYITFYLKTRQSDGVGGR